MVLMISYVSEKCGPAAFGYNTKIGNAHKLLKTEHPEWFLLCIVGIGGLLDF